MDFVKLSRDSRDLLERLAGRLPEGELESCRSLGKAGEWGELIDLLSAVLVKQGIPVSRAERDDLSALLHMYPIPMEGYDYISNRDQTLAALTITAQ